MVGGIESKNIEVLAPQISNLPITALSTENCIIAIVSTRSCIHVDSSTFVSVGYKNSALQFLSSAVFS